MSALPLAPTDRDETPAEFFRRISNPPTPHFDKLAAFAKGWQQAQTEEKLAEAIKHRDHYNQLARETRDMAAERETFQAREATMAASTRYKAQALVWEREVCALTAQLNAAPVPEFVPSAKQVAAVDETMEAKL